MKKKLPFWCGAIAFAFALSAQAQNVTEVSGTIDSNSTWTRENSPYLITSSVEVAEGVTLVVEPGVEVRMARYTNFAVSGSLVADGTEEASIVWRGSTGTANWWQGIQLNDASNGAFNHCRIENAGYGSQAALDKLGAGNLSIQNSVIADNFGIGLWIHTSTASVTSSANQFLNNATGVRLSIGASFDDDDSTFLDNNLDVQLDAGNIANAVTLNIHPDYSIYCAGSITIQSTGILNILPDTTLKMAQYARLNVDGELNASGTSPNPIYFTHWRDDSVGGDANHDGSDSSPGSNWWQGILVRDAGSAEMTYCNIHYSGYSSSPGIYKTGTGSLVFNNSISSNHSGDGMRCLDSSGSVEILSSTFANNGGVGMRLQNSPVAISDCTFDQNANYGLMQNPNDIVDYSENTFTDNVAGSVLILSGEMSVNRHWMHGLGDDEFTIDLSGNLTVATGVSLEVDPGIIVRADRYALFKVDGELTAVGSSDEPIQFIGAVASKNHWQGLRLSDGATGTLVFCVIKNAGYSSNAALQKLGSGDLTLQNCILRDSGNNGLYVKSSAATLNDSDNQYINNGTGVRLAIGVSLDDPAPSFQDNGLDVFLEGGDIESDVVWNLDPAYSIFYSANVTVKPNASLTIGAGTVIKAARYSRLFVDGTLIVNGAAGAPVYWTHWEDDTVGGDANKDGTDSAPEANWWQGITVRENAAASLDYCHIRYGGYSSTPGLAKTGAGLLVFNNGSCSLGHNNGLSLLNLTEPAEITNSSFSENAGSGLSVSNAPSIISGNLFETNTGFGLMQKSNDLVDYSLNTFSGNAAGSVQILNGSLSVDHHWTHGQGDPIFTVDLEGSVTVDAGAALVVDPGVIVKVARYALFTINGTLTSVGDAENPVQFIGAQDSSNWWQGIRINDTASADFQFSRIANAGYSSGAGILLNGIGGSLNLENNVIENNSGDGIRISGTYASFNSSNNMFRNNGRGANILIGATLDDISSVFEGNGSDIQLAGGTITRDTTWNVAPNLSLLLAGNVTVNSGFTLSIGPGTTIKVPRYCILTINGSLNCPGEAGAQIHFTHPSDDSVGGDSNQDGDQSGPSANWWQGISVTTGASADLKNTTLQYGGYASSPGLRFVGTGTLNVEDCVFSDCFSHGIYLEGTGESTVEINNSVSQNNGQSGLRWVSGPITVDQCSFLNNGNYGAWLNAGLAFDFSKNQFSGNASHSLGVQPGNITSNTTWTRGQGDSFTAAMLGSLTLKPEASWTIHPGISCYFDRYSKLTIEGGLVAQGNQNAPIRFMGSTQNPTWWQGISVIGEGSANMVYCEISNSGYASQSGLAVTGTGALNLEFSRLYHNSGNGLLIHDHSGPSNIAHSLFESNGTGVRVTSNTNQPVALTLCGIYDNNVGVNNTGTDNLDARSCWWGDASGPQHPELNPDGTGNSVSDKVLFDPWKLDASLIHPWISVTEVVLYLIALAESKVELSWSDQFPEAQLQSSSDFLIWETVDQAPTMSEGRYRVTLDQIEAGTMGFRIHP